MTPQERYDARTAVRICLKLNKGTDTDILQKLKEVPNKQGYIKQLIRRDIGGQPNHLNGMTRRQREAYERMQDLISDPQPSE